ncbi:MAG: DUF4910 domain-containing protein [Desulfuromusa sp.]|nr:DUF4910 domain-containing protein [Desulfuromusa sp.]
MLKISEDILLEGAAMHKWATDLFPICRSITGQGVRDTLGYIKNLLPMMTIEEVPSGTQAFDWVVPDEWNIYDAYIADESGQRIVDFKKNNLHVVGYSEPIDQWMTLEELDNNLYSLPDQPTAIPYVTSYYSRRWGFCLSHEQTHTIKPGSYHVVINSELKPGFLNYAELRLPGKSKEEVFLSTYICHPSMANDQLSGPVVATALAKWLSSQERLRYSYRIVFIPETIGSIVYISRNLTELKQRVIAGFNISCVGDERCYSYLPSRAGNTVSDQAAQHVLKYIDKDYIKYTWLDRASDECQYCSPGVDLPMASIMRSKYGVYPEYHTSLDDLNFVTPVGLAGSLLALKTSIEIIENNYTFKTTSPCEPQLGKRGLYPTLSTKSSSDQMRAIMSLISYCDGSKSLLEIADIIDQPFWKVQGWVNKLREHDLLQLV